MNWTTYIFYTWLVFVAVSAITHQVLRRVAVRENVKKFQDSIKELVDTIGTRIAGVEKNVAANFASEVRLRDPRPTNRVYAFIMQQGRETRLFIQPSQTFEEMFNIVTRELGPNWLLTASAYVDVLPSEVAPVVHIDTIMDKKPTDFIHSLEYSRDVFATTATQKKALETIINRLKNDDYGTRSNSGSAA